MRTLLIIILLSGCASTQHRHPHDHGLSALKGRINQVNSDMGRLLDALRNLQIEIVTAHGGIVAVKKRLEDVEAFEKQINDAAGDRVELSNLIDIHVNELQAQILSISNRAVGLKEKLQEHSEALESLRRRLTEVEEKDEPQKIEPGD